MNYFDLSSKMGKTNNSSRWKKQTIHTDFSSKVMWQILKTYNNLGISTTRRNILDRNYIIAIVILNDEID